MNDQEKARRKRQRMLDKAREYTTGTYSRKVATVFQRMIRAEVGARHAGVTPAIVDGQLTMVFRKVGECVCVTCGKVGPWSSGLGGMHTGHFLPSRRNSILFEEANVAPQCSRCNRYESGAQQPFTNWMLSTRGGEAVERLKRLKHTTRQFTIDELVDMRIEYKARLDTAIARMSQPQERDT